MFELHLPWLEMAIVAPLIAALWAVLSRDPERARQITMIGSGAALVFAIGAWEDFNLLRAFEAHDRWDFVSRILGPNVLLIDELSAPLLPLTALLFFLTSFTTLRTKVRRFPFAGNLVLEFLMLATLACRDPWGVTLLSSLQVLPLWIELRSRGQCTRVFTIHMTLFVGLLVSSWALISAQQAKQEPASMLAITMLIAAVLIRSGCCPVHCWLTDLFEKASLGSSILFVTPMMGAYLAVRLVMPVSPAWALQAIALASIFTAVYSAGIAIVQLDSRRYFSYLLLSNASMVLVGIEVATPIGLTGSLCVWLSVGLALTGLGLTLRAIEARVGRISLRDYHGLYNHMPLLATFFLLTGLASVGFPGTIGFVGLELLVEGAVGIYPVVGMAVVIAALLNSVGIVRTYFRLFAGTEYPSTFSLGARWPERLAVLVFAILIIGGGLFPQPGVSSRFHAAKELIHRSGEASGKPIIESVTEPHH